MEKFKDIIGKIVCICLFILMISGMVYTCTYQKDYTNELYFNKKGIIVKMGSEEGYTNDKFHNATQNHTLLIMDLKDTTSFLEWRTSAEDYYNYNVGDTVHFKHIRKERWFKINKKTKK